jgi:hypothetical protein
MRFLKKTNHTTPDRYSENSQGDFYVENGVCITCGAPESEAPDLIEHSQNAYGHCFLRNNLKQKMKLNEQ